jgi:hypothetical protein
MHYLCTHGKNEYKILGAILEVEGKLRVVEMKK